MRSVLGSFGDAEADLVRGLLQDIVGSDETGRYVTYCSPGQSVTSGAGGYVTSKITERLIRVYRGARKSQTGPGFETGTRQYIVRKDDLTAPSPIVPKKGDWIKDDDGKFHVESVSSGDVGPALIYWLLDVKAGGP